MELLITDIRNKSDKKLLTDLLKRLGLSYKELSEQEKEDYAFGIAIKEGRKSGLVQEKEVMYTLSKKTKK